MRTRERNTQGSAGPCPPHQENRCNGGCATHAQVWRDQTLIMHPHSHLATFPFILDAHRAKFEQALLSSRQVQIVHHDLAQQ